MQQDRDDFRLAAPKQDQTDSSTFWSWRFVSASFVLRTMSSPDGNVLSSSPTSILIDTDATFSRREEGTQRHSPTLTRTLDVEEALARQRAMDVDSAMLLCECVVEVRCP